MILFRFDGSAGRQVDAFESDFMLSSILELDSPAHVDVIYLPPGGRVGRHAAASDQLFLAVDGRGMAAGSDGVEWALRPGTAAFWTRGERHHVRTDEGLTAVVIEGEALKPGDSMATLPPSPC